MSHTGFGVANNVFVSPQRLGHAAWQGAWPMMPPAMGEPSAAPGGGFGGSAAAASWDGVMRRSLELGAPQGIVWHYQPTMSWAGPSQAQQGTTPLSAVPVASHATMIAPPSPGANGAEPQPRAQVPAPSVSAVCSQYDDDDRATDRSSSSSESEEEEGKQAEQKAEQAAAAAESAAARASRELLATCLPSAEDGGLQQRVSQLRVALEAAEKRVENSTQEVRASCQSPRRVAQCV
jgi:hypothetical protein